MLSLPPHANKISCVAQLWKVLDRYTGRHDSVLSHLQQFFKILKTSSKVYWDSDQLQYNITLQLFTTQCLDIVILDNMF